MANVTSLCGMLILHRWAMGTWEGERTGSHWLCSSLVALQASLSGAEPGLGPSMWSRVSALPRTGRTSGHLACSPPVCKVDFEMVHIPQCAPWGTPFVFSEGVCQNYNACDKRQGGRERKAGDGTREDGEEGSQNHPSTLKGSSETSQQRPVSEDRKGMGRNMHQEQCVLEGGMSVCVCGEPE